MRKYFLLLLFFFSALLMWADNASNVRIRQEGKSIIITYDLSKRSNVSVYVKSKERPNWYKLKHMIGHKGENIASGKNKQVVWYPLKEFDSFVGSNVQFKVETANFENGHEYVDLGLSVKWATCNVGADSPEDYGDYFAWGEVDTKIDYSNWTYKYSVFRLNLFHFIKYCTKRNFGYEGFSDKKTVLDFSDDAAKMNWGGGWRMPTDAEMTELRENCKWIWTTYNGVNGYNVVGLNGNSIFLPAAGWMYCRSLDQVGLFGRYWSRSLHIDNMNWAYSAFFSSSKVGKGETCRDYGLSVRPVCK